MNLDKVKERIRKLLAIADDDRDADGEVSAAMALAEKALQEYHLTRADIEAENKSTASPTIEEKYGTADAFSHGRRVTPWENQLWLAIETLVGSVHCYRTQGSKEVGTFKKIKLSDVLRWYGTAEDATLAAELFGEWQTVIATIAIGRYGGFARNDGAKYAYGFTESLREKAVKIADDRKNVTTASTTAIVLVGSGSLADVLRDKTKKADNWLATQGVKLYAGRRNKAFRVIGESVSAYSAGRVDGQRAEFTAVRRKKLM